MNTRLCRAVLLVPAIFLSAHLALAQEPSPAWPVQLGWMFGGEGVCASCVVGTRFGLEAGLEVQYQLPLRRLALRNDGMLHIVGANACTPGGTAFRNDCVGPQMPREMWAWSGELVGRLFDPAVRWSPYVLGGGSEYWEQATSAQPAASRFGLLWGFGMELRPRTTSTLFLEWRRLSFSPRELTPVMFGVRF